MVKCVDCGFLAARNVQSRELEEVEEEFRQSGKPATIDIKIVGYHGEPVTRHMAHPLCFAQVIRFGQIGTGGTLVAAFNEERDCAHFTNWQQGFTPKEHKEMLDRQWLLDKEESRDRNQREWQERESRMNRHWRFAELVVAIVALGLIVFAAYIERSGQPIIQIITQDRPTIQSVPSIPNTEKSQR